MSFGVHDRRAVSTTDWSDLLTTTDWWLVWCVEHTHPLSLTHTHTDLDRHVLAYQSAPHWKISSGYQNSSITHTVPKQFELDSVCITLCVYARAREREREMREEWVVRIWELVSAVRRLQDCLFHFFMWLWHSIREQPCGAQKISVSSANVFFCKTRSWRTETTPFKSTGK